MHTPETIEENRKKVQLTGVGQVLDYHHVGRYTLVEVLDRFAVKEAFGQALTVKEVRLFMEPRHEHYLKIRDCVRYSVFVDGEDKHVFSKTLEGAMLLAIARTNLSTNEAGYAARFAAQILGVSSDY